MSFFLRPFLLTLFSFFEPFLGMDRFKSLVESKERIDKFKTNYRILPNVGLRYCKEDEWHFLRQEGEVVIPMIAFIEGGVRILMGPVMWICLRFVRLTPTQCVPNVFRILGCVDALNEKMGLQLTYHDVNWVYSLYYLKGKGYYLKTRQPEVRLIQCLPESSKGQNKDFLIVYGEWHDGFLCSTKEGQLGGALEIGLELVLFLIVIYVVRLLAICFSWFCRQTRR